MRVAAIVSLFVLFGIELGNSKPLPSSIEDETVKDPSLQEMEFDLGWGTEYFEFFMEPDMKAVSQGEFTEAKKPLMNGHAVKFFNMSPNTVRYFWVNNNGHAHPMGLVRPFHCIGTASFPGHNFFFGPEDYETNKIVLQSFNIDQDGTTNLYYYDPIEVPGNKTATELNLAQLTMDEFEKYNIMVRNRKFAQVYREITGREYLSMYPRKQPHYFMWPADYFGQEHWVTSKETQFDSVPRDKLERIREYGSKRVFKEGDPLILAEHRKTDEFMNMTLKVLSCRPRVYEIENFLSDAEVDHIIHLADSMNLQASSTGSGANSKVEKETRTRTSYNTWVGRETDQVIDTIYRRSADLLKIDESYFRYRDKDERPDVSTLNSIAEQLQLVHYDHGQEYTAHHDFGYAPVKDKNQPARFATLLLYLNDVEEGGETEFPRWSNGHTNKGLFATPKKGKAVLFYSFLPDGNLDDLSQHAAKPVTKGEKYLINLWVNDPVFDR